MIQKFVDRFMRADAQSVLRAQFSTEAPHSYEAIVKAVITTIRSDEYGDPDPERIHTIDDGDYQGTLLFVIAAGGYQPHDYWYVKVGYGSCSGCDTLQAINSSGEETPTVEQVDQYMTLALHVLQGLKALGEEVA